MIGAALNATVSTVSEPIPAADDNGGSGGSGGGGDNTLVIVGAVVGAILAIALVVGVVFGLRYFSRRREESEKAKAMVKPATSARPLARGVALQESKLDAAAVKRPAWEINSTPAASSAMALRPPPPPSAPQAKRLPEGWTEHFDDDGNPYYFHAKSGKSRWSQPTYAE